MQTPTSRTGPPAPAPTDGPDPSDAAVAVRGLVKRYGRNTAVRGLDLVARYGQITAVLGPNGAGKTTTIECCEGLRRPDDGTVRVLGLDPVRQMADLRPRVGVMLQDGGLPSTVPAAEVLRHVAAMYARPADLGELRERLGIDAFGRTQVRRLSGGQRQRLALATALVGRPEVAFLDEPSAGMDPQARLAVWALVRELRDAGTTIVVTTHQMGEAEAIADHVVVVDDGRTVAAGTVDELVGGTGASNGTVRVQLAVTETTPADPELAQGLGRALHRSTGAEHPVTATATRGTLEVAVTPAPALVHAVTAWARDADVLVTSLTTGRRTLEDVFLDLTGRSLR